MLHHWFAQPEALSLLVSLPALLVLALWNRWRRRRALDRLGNPASLRALVETPGGRRFWRGLLLTLGLVLLIVGAAGPQWGRDWDQSAAPGRDLVVVLDCSPSMFAETPSRLERAKAALLDLADAQKKRGGHRVALVVFAAQARLACPLTHDYDHFREVVESVDTEAPDPDLEPGPGAVSGTRIGEALHEALATHDERNRGARDILLLSDGDDPVRDGEWQNGRDEAREQGVPVYVVGLGDPDRAATIHVAGKDVQTKLVEAPLRDIAGATRGDYVSARTRALPLGQVYLDAVAGQALRPDEADDDRLPAYRPHYVWFLGAAFAFLAPAVVLRDRRRRLPPAADSSLSIAPARTP
jgi:Ca-activated chloride channel family protein